MTVAEMGYPASVSIRASCVAGIDLSASTSAALAP